MVTLWPSLTVATSCVAVIVQGARIVTTFPATANHYYLQLLLLGLFALLDSFEPTERRLLLVLCRLTTLLVIFHAGLQKLLHGHYFDGRMLATLISKHERYAGFFSPFVSSSEIRRFASYNLHASGSGPYTFESSLMIVVSNVTWLGEILLAGMLLLVRRDWSAWITIAFFACMELAAREVVFGYLMIGMAIAFLRNPGTTVTRLWLVFGATLCAVALDYVPGRGLWFPLGDS